MDTTPEPPAPATPDLFCPHCQYNLRGTTCVRCPECGQPFDRAALTAVTIPWAHRREIGRSKAFWKTTFLVTFRVRTLTQNANAPVRLDDALAYRRTVVLHLLVPLAALLGACWGLADESGLNPIADRYVMGATWPVDAFRGDLAYFVYYIPPPWSVLVLFAAAWLWLLMLSAMPTLYFAPRRLDGDQQRRAVALAYYACAPLFFACLLLPFLTLGVWGEAVYSGAAGAPDRRLAYAIALGGWCVGIAGLLPLFRAWWVPVCLLPQVTRCSARRVWALALTLPLLWLVSALLTLVLLAAVAFYATVIWYSLHG